LVSGKVLRRHAGGYLVHSEELNVVIQCSLRSRMKKEGISVFTGDLVELSEVELPLSGSLNGSAVIAARRERKNLLTRPFIANLDQVFIVQSMHQPEWNALLCDRYIVTLQLVLDDFRCFICLNKCDLACEESLTAIRNIYEPLGYQMFFVSARTGAGIAELNSVLAGRTSVLIGPSGVGKSSIINRLIPDLNLKVDINEDLAVGRHTTTYSELYKIPLCGGPGSEDACAWIADTPGFIVENVEYPQPADVAWQFPEIIELARDCRFSNCLHIGEDGCNVEERLSQISPSRYESYCVIIADAQNEARIRSETSSKVDAGTRKQVGGHRQTRVLPRLAEHLRADSRRKKKQGLGDYRKSGAEVLDEDDDEELENDNVDEGAGNQYCDP
jgi:ribosome biogenesis GTPase / thiamine phosphate phosphatase